MEKVSAKSSYKAMLEENNKKIKESIENMFDPTSKMTEEERTAYRNRIMAKLKNGKRLTAEEMNYLQIHEPKMYLTAMRVKNAKQILENKLKHCRTKQQANRVIGQAVSSISDKDPDKQYLVAGVRVVAEEYKKSAQYARLPETEQDSDHTMTPIYELLNPLPVFDVTQ